MFRGNFAGAVAGVASEKQSPPEQGRVFPAIQPACLPRSRREQGFPLKPNLLCSDPQSRATPHPPVPFPVMPSLSTCQGAYAQPRLASRPPPVQRAPRVLCFSACLGFVSLIPKKARPSSREGPLAALCPPHILHACHPVGILHVEARVSSLQALGRGPPASA